MNVIKKINHLYRKIMFHFSDRSIEAILKYDPLNVLEYKDYEKEVNK